VPEVTGDKPEYRAFDFWIGDWIVSDPESGAVLGANRIQPILGGVVLHESWRGANGVAGESFNIYDDSRGVWHQSWVDQTGSLLMLDGGIRAGAMVMEGRKRDVLHRIRWTPQPDGSVIQQWESSENDGTTWVNRFKGHYRQRPA
jgi:hypothetical protein